MADEKLTVEITGKDTLTPELKKIESRVIRFVGAVSSALSAVAVIAFPVLESASFQKELLQAAKTTGYAKGQIEELKLSLVGLSTQINVSAQDLAKIATMGGQLGIGKDDASALVKFTEEVARAVSAMDISAEEATASLGKLITIFKIPSTEFRNVIAALSDVADASTATATQLFDVVRRIGDLGGAVNIQGATAISAAMIDLGMTAETAGTTITKIFSKMRVDAQKFAAFVGNGMTVERWVSLLQGQGLKALDLFLDKLNSIQPTAAAAAQMEMVGGGRIFEAMTKLRQQRLSATLLEEQADRRAKELQEVQSTLSASQLKHAQDTIQALRDQAKEANVVTRLADEADSAYSKGTAALRKQQTVLSGLSAQWTVFNNNVSKAAMGIGDSLLIPITEGLRKLSSLMQDTNMAEEFSKSIRDMISVLKEAAGFLSYFIGGFKSLGDTDWGALLKVGVIAVAMKSFSLLSSVLNGLGTRLSVSAGMAGAFSRAIFGTTVATEAARQELIALQKETDKGNKAIGGLFRNAAASTVGFSNGIGQVRTITQDIANSQMRMAQGQQMVAARQQIINGLFSQFGRGKQTLLGLQDALAVAQARYDAAVLAGNNRAMARNATEIKRYSDGIQAISRQEAAVAKLQASLATMGAAVTDAQAKLVGLRTGAVGIASAFSDAYAATNSFGAALKAALLSVGAGGGNVGYITRITDALVAAGAAADRLYVATRRAFSQGGSSLLLSSINAISNAYLYMYTGGFSRAYAGISAGFKSISSTIGGVILRTYEMEAVWAAAAPGMQRRALAVALSFRMIGDALSRVKKIALGLVNFVFLATMIKEVLQVIGLWDKLTKAIERTVVFFGGSKDMIPGWLKTTDAADRAVRKTKEQELAYKSLREEAAKFTKQSQVELAILQDLESTARKIGSDDGSTRNLSGVTDSTDALTAATAKLIELQQSSADWDKQRADQLKVLEDAQKRYNSLREKAGQIELRPTGTLGSVTAAAQMSAAKADLDEQQAAYDNIVKAQKARIALEKQLADTVPAASARLIRSVVQQTDALMTYNDGQQTGIDLLEQWANEQAKFLRAQQAVDAKIAAAQPATRAPGDMGGQAVARKYTAELEALQAAADDAKESVSGMERALYSLTPGNVAFPKVIEALKKNGSPEAMEAFGKDARRGLEKGIGKDMGLAVPKLGYSSFLEAGATLAVSEDLRKMYEGMAASAKANADKAKNAVGNAASEAERVAKDAAKAMESMARMRDDAKTRASNYKQDQSMDVDLRRRLVNIDVERKRDEERARARYGWNDRLLAQELNYIAEKYNKEEEAERQIVELKKAKRNADQDIKQYDALVKKANDYIKVMEAANKVLENPASSIEEQQKALNDKADAEVRAKAAADEALRAAQELSKIPQIGDKFVIPEDKLEAIAKEATSIGGLINKASSEAATESAKVYETMAGRYTELARQHATALDSAKEAMQQFALQSGKTQQDVIADFAKAASAATDYGNYLKSTAELVGKIKMKPELFSKDDVTKASGDIAKTFADSMSNVSATVKLTPDQQTLATELNNKLNAIVSEGNMPVAKFGADFAPGTLEAMKAAIQDIKPVIKADIIMNSPNSFSDKAGAPKSGRARGGLIQGFASGGKVSGPGTGTSDSILSWLSHGEYVMDALTTARFGSKFFAKLQALARGGTSSTFMSRLRGIGLPGFASGGPVASPYSGSLPVVQKAMGALMSEADSPSRDVVEINFNSGGKKISLFAERRQATEFVRTLKSMETGA